jgi:nitrite reductase/ring-hydroxylating ferredoxin subunit
MMAWFLERGKDREDCAIIGSWHHRAFDLESSGVKEWCLWAPGLGSVSREERLLTFPTGVEHGHLWARVPG